ncbi:hypothetical protein BC835DRAFT_1402395 [Cytidiella melzeri]|nr:hypothetical protein BC835DRAFT_1402395 [Cytidiella melzeri]
MKGPQRLMFTPALGPLNSLHSCSAYQAPLVPNLSAIVLNQPIFSSSEPLAAGSVPTLISGQTLNWIPFLLGLFVFLSVAAKRGNLCPNVKPMQSKTASPKLAPSTPVRKIAVLSAVDEPEYKSSSSVNLSSDLDDTLDEQSLVSPSGTGFFVNHSSPKMLTSSEAPSPMPLSVESPVFRHIWRSNAVAVAEIAYKRRRAAIVTKLQRWAAKRHEQAVQEASRSQQLSTSVSGSSLKNISNRNSGILSSLSFEKDQLFSPSVGGAFGYGKAISPSAQRKLRVRRECLRERAREVKAAHTAMSNMD